MRKIKQTDRPFLIAYQRGDRRLWDSARTLAGAVARIEERGERIKGESATVYHRGLAVYDAVGDRDHAPTSAAGA